MSKKDKILLFLLCVLTSILLSLVLNQIYFKMKYGQYIIEAYKNSEEAIESLNKLDSLYIID